MTRARFLALLLATQILIVVNGAALFLLFLALGILLNGLVSQANGWRMPVRIRFMLESKTHTPMTPITQFRWCGDWIRVGPIVASPGDAVLTVALVLMIYKWVLL